MTKLAHHKKRTEMSTEELRALQEPFKTRYRDLPGTAIVTLSANGTLGDGITCCVQAGKTTIEAGLHPAVGGTGRHACAAEMMLEALVACAGVTLAAVATYLGIPIDAGTIRAEGELDLRGTLGVSNDVPVGFQRMKLFFDLDTTATEQQLKTLLELTEQYCVVGKTIANRPTLSISKVNPK
jgi:uncharacterized OsmC-like protein